MRSDSYYVDAMRRKAVYTDRALGVKDAHAAGKLAFTIAAEFTNRSLPVDGDGISTTIAAPIADWLF